MTDKTPTDAELKAMWQLHAADIGGIFYYARAVLAKWGTLRADKIVIPTDTMEQEFQQHYRRGYEAGKKASTPQHTQQPAPAQAAEPVARLEIESLKAQLHAAKQINAAQFGLLAASIPGSALRASHGQAPAETGNSVSAQADSVQEDAARYRWLRDQAHPDSEDSGIAVSESDFNDWGNKFTRYYSGEELDAAIDAAMNKGATQ